MEDRMLLSEAEGEAITQYLEALAEVNERFDALHMPKLDTVINRVRETLGVIAFATMVGLVSTPDEVAEISEELRGGGDFND